MVTLDTYRHRENKKPQVPGGDTDGTVELGFRKGMVGQFKKKIHRLPFQITLLDDNTD